MIIVISNSNNANDNDDSNLEEKNYNNITLANNDKDITDMSDVTFISATKKTKRK